MYLGGVAWLLQDRQSDILPRRASKENNQNLLSFVVMGLVDNVDTGGQEKVSRFVSYDNAPNNRFDAVLEYTSHGLHQLIGLDHAQYYHLKGEVLS